MGTWWGVARLLGGGPVLPEETAVNEAAVNKTAVNKTELAAVLEPTGVTGLKSLAGPKAQAGTTAQADSKAPAHA
jgi:hypothetical protein